MCLIEIETEQQSGYLGILRDYSTLDPKKVLEEHLKRKKKE